MKARKHISFNKRKRNASIGDFGKDFQKLRNNEFHGKTIEIERHRLKINFLKKDDDEEFTKQQSKVNLNGAHNLYTKY